MVRRLDVPYTFEIAATDADRQACRALAVACNGHGFCPPDAPPDVLVNALDSFRANELTWIAGRDLDGTLVAVECLALGHLPGGTHLAVVAAVRPDVFTLDLARQLQESLATLALDGPAGDEPDRWVAILSARSPMLDTIISIYGGPEYVTVSPYQGDPRMDLVRLEGVLVNRRPPGFTRGDDR